MLLRLSDSARLFHADCRDAIRSLPDNSVDSVVTDPPYALVSIVKRFGKPDSAPAKGNDAYMRASAGFMQKSWDVGDVAFATEFWSEVLRVLKPGGHLAAFGGTRTQHRLVCAIEDAGFEIRDSLMWVYGTGFPKSHDVSKGIDKLDAADMRRDRQLRFTEWMRNTGLTRATATELLRSAGVISENGTMAGHFFAASADGQPAVATRELFETMRPHFGCDVPAWVEAMVDERTVESENFKRREVTQEATAISRSGEAIGFDQRSSSQRERRDIPATDAARQWEGWGTALKPAFEPIVLARKPLGTGDIDVRRNVEKELRKCGITSEIVWVEESAETANSLRKNTNSPRERQASSVENATVNEITNTEPATSKKLASPIENGTQITDKNISTPLNADMMRSASKSLNIMVESAPVAANANRTSLPSITSTEAERNTENLSDKRSTQTSASVVSPLDSEHFAGIATGLTDSMEHVHIKRKGGSFVWPKELPTFVPSRPLTVAANVLRWGTGALNIDGCRVGMDANDRAEMEGRSDKSTPNKIYGANINGGGVDEGTWKPRSDGRWPANCVHDGSDEVVGAFPNTGPSSGRPRHNGEFKSVAKGRDLPHTTHGHTDNGGSAARFFYSAKASRADRAGSKHPTVKPIALMQWLARLITPPGGTVLDPFAGSGTTGEAARREGFSVILCEREDEYVEDIRARFGAPAPDPLARVLRWNAAVASYRAKVAA